jgi:hypothetical protein
VLWYIECWFPSCDCITRVTVNIYEFLYCILRYFNHCSNRVYCIPLLDNFPIVAMCVNVNVWKYFVADFMNFCGTSVHWVLWITCSAVRPEDEDTLFLQRICSHTSTEQDGFVKQKIEIVMCVRACARARARVVFVIKIKFAQNVIEIFSVGGYRTSVEGNRGQPTTTTFSRWLKMCQTTCVGSNKSR